MLIPAYDKVKNTLQPQVQGTCGIYSFYTAVQILRKINSKNPAVPAPKKSEIRWRDKGNKSLREYAKRQLQSGQGELLSTGEISRLIGAYGYAPLSFGRRASVDANAKKTFVEMCMRENYPVLIAYLADQVGNDITYVTEMTDDPGAHWSLIIGVDGDQVKVVEPNAPRALLSWPMDDLFLANSHSDDAKFARFWAKTVDTEKEAKRQLKPSGSKGRKKDSERGVVAVGDDNSDWAPNFGKKGGQVKLYDLGGTTGTRHTDQDLNHVLVAVIPPH